MRETILAGLDGLPEQWTILLETTASRSSKAGTEAVRLMTERGHAIIIAATKPAQTLLSTYEAAGIDTGKVHIIDCVSQGQQGRIEDHEQVVYVDSVSSLTDISIAVTKHIEAIRESGSEPFVFLDSINSLLLHNDPTTIARFIHGLLTRIRLKEISGMLLGVEDSIDDVVRSKVAQLCDRVVPV